MLTPCPHRCGRHIIRQLVRRMNKLTITIHSSKPPSENSSCAHKVLRCQVSGYSRTQEQDVRRTTHKHKYIHTHTHSRCRLPRRNLCHTGRPGGPGAGEERVVHQLLHRVPLRRLGRHAGCHERRRFRRHVPWKLDKTDNACFISGLCGCFSASRRQR